MRRVFARTVLLAALPLALGACASTDMGGGSYRVPAQPSGPSVISGSGSTAAAGPVIAGPPGCAGPISEYQQIIDRDVESGMLNPGVYNRVSTDLEGVKRACAEGREKEAVSQLAGVRQRYGYR